MTNKPKDTRLPPGSGIAIVFLASIAFYAGIAIYFAVKWWIA